MNEIMKETQEGATFVSMKLPKPPLRLCLDCECHDPRCFIWFEYEYEKGSVFSNAPFLEVSIEYCHLHLWDRLKAAWKLLRTGDETREADVVLNGEENMRKLKEFAEKCLQGESL